jgi:hypothetical protein
MSVQLVKEENNELTIQVSMKLTGSMLEMEELIQQAVNEVGVAATEKALERFDTDGSPLVMGGIKFYANHKKMENTYETPYGRARIGRFVYQTAKGGRTYCPLEVNARIIQAATPKFAKMIASKYADAGVTRVNKDLAENHNRQIAKSYIQNVAELVGSIAIAKEEIWEYQIPQLDEVVKTISLGLDGTSMYITNYGKRQAMVATLALHNEEGERLYTTYIASSPEYGKASFLSKFTFEIEELKKKYPAATYVGIADGALDNWTFLKAHTDKQIIDFFHAAGYISKAADVLYGKDNTAEKKQWISEHCHLLKHTQGYAEAFYSEMQQKEKEFTKPDEIKVLDSVLSYFKNKKEMMSYPEYLGENLPIGSGITEAACKVIVKQRMCCSGMKWKDKGAKIVLSLRTLNYSTGRWDQFWSKLDQYGVPQELAEPIAA